MYTINRSNAYKTLFKKTLAPTPAPSTKQPSGVPTSLAPVTLSPTKAKVVTPYPTADPFDQIEHIKVTIPSSLTLQGAKVPRDPIELDAVVSTVSGAIQASALVKLQIKHKNGKLRIRVVIKSINGEPIEKMRKSMISTSIGTERLLRHSRDLQNQDLSTIEYELIIEELCEGGPTGACSDSQSLANNLYSLATSSMREQIDSGEFLNQLDAMAASLNVDALFNEAVVGESDFGALTLALLSLLSSYYPDWESPGSYCTNNANSVPLYMMNNPAWKSSSLEACCTKYFSYSIGACMGGTALQGADASLVWYPDWLGGSGACVDDASNVPDYMLQNRRAWMSDNKEACCTKYYTWAVGHCMGGTVMQGVDASLVWYPDWLGGSSDCVDDLTKVPEYMLQNRVAWMYADKESCCKKYYGYNVASCMGDDFVQSGVVEWYVDWTSEECVKSCPLSNSDTKCGGYRATWQPSYESVTACCKKLHWIPTAECLA